MTKKEILQSKTDGWVGGMTLGDQERIVYPAMDDFAKQQSIEFFKWNNEKIILYSNYIVPHTEKELEEITKFENATVEERYDLFEEENKIIQSQHAK